MILLCPSGTMDIYKLRVGNQHFANMVKMTCMNGHQNLSRCQYTETSVNFMKKASRNNKTTVIFISY